MSPSLPHSAALPHYPAKPEIIAALKSSPMTLPHKEAIFVQMFGHCDDLYRDSAPRRKRPLAERTVEASREGAFIELRTEPDGSTVYSYCKRGEPTYELVVRDGVPCFCGCEDFRRGVMGQPDYICKHASLWMTMELGLEALIEICGRAAMDFMVARQRMRAGEDCGGEAREAYERMRDADIRIGCFLTDAERGIGSVFQTVSRAEQKQDRPLAAAA